MAKPNQTNADTEHAQAILGPALRTLEMGGAGVGALAAALRDGLGASFVAAIDLIRNADAAKAAPAPTSDRSSAPMVNSNAIVSATRDETLRLRSKLPGVVPA